MPNTDTIIFSMASRITAQFPNITVKDAMTLATIAMDEFSSHNTTNKRTSKATKPKDPTKPKRTKLAQQLLTLLNFLLTQMGRIPLLQQLLPPVHAVSATTVLPV